MDEIGFHCAYSNNNPNAEGANGLTCAQQERREMAERLLHSVILNRNFLPMLCPVQVAVDRAYELADALIQKSKKQE